MKTPCHSHTTQSCSTSCRAGPWSTLLWTSQLWEGAHRAEAQHAQQEQPGEDERSSLGVSKEHGSTGTGSSLKPQYLLPREQTGWGKSRMQPEFWTNFSKQHSRSTEYLYCHKSYGPLFYIPNTHEISPDKESFIHSWYFIAKPTKMSENHTCS